MLTIVLFCSLLSVVLLSGLFCKSKLKVDNYTFLAKGYTDTLRGLAMIMIIFGHVAGTYHEGVWFSPFASTGVAMFLFLSGYGNNESYLKKKSFKLDKLLKIGMPYWIIVILLFFIRYDNYTIRDLILGLGFVKPLISGYWFVSYIFLCYLVYWFAVNYAYNFRWLIFSSFAIISFIALPSLESEQSLSFIAGIFVSEKKECMINISAKKWNVVATVFFIFGIIVLGLKQVPYVRESDIFLCVVQLLYKLPFAFAIIIAMRELTVINRNKFLFFIAPITYELYLVHMPLLRFVNGESNSRILLTTIVFFIAILGGAKLFNILNVRVQESIGCKLERM